jgi:hypothetical protein
MLNGHKNALVRTLWRRSVNPTARDDVTASSLCVFCMEQHYNSSALANNTEFLHNTLFLFYSSAGTGK